MKKFVAVLITFLMINAQDNEFEQKSHKNERKLLSHYLLMIPIFAGTALYHYLTTEKPKFTWDRDGNWGERMYQMQKQNYKQNPNKREQISMTILNTIYENYAGAILNECAYVIKEESESKVYGNQEKMTDEFGSIYQDFFDLEKTERNEEQEKKFEELKQKVELVEMEIEKHNYIYDTLLNFCHDYYQFMIKGAPANKFFLHQKFVFKSYKLAQAYQEFEEVEQGIFNDFLFKIQFAMDKKVDNKFIQIDEFYKEQYYLILNRVAKNFDIRKQLFVPQDQFNLQ